MRNREITVQNQARHHIVGSNVPKESKRSMPALMLALAMALAGCAHSPGHGARVKLLNTIVEYWARQKPDYATLLYIDPAYCALPVASKLRKEGFKIYSTREPRPPRNSWDTDESVSWTELDVSEIQIKGDHAKARVRTIWQGGAVIEEYSLSRRDGKWFVR